MNKPLQALLINPPVYDVSAYGFWSAPLGLLYVGSVLRESGMSLTLLDCMREKEDKRREDGRAPFIKERVALAGNLAGPGKGYRRYGLPREAIEAHFRNLEPPDLVLVTCIMTYWYPGAVEVVRLAREVFPKARIVVGGLYASLCNDHARATLEGADLVVGKDGLTGFYRFVEEAFGFSLRCGPSGDELDAMPYPAFDLYDKRAFVPLLTSVGCMYRCTYCATPYLRPSIMRRDTGSVLREIAHWHDRGIFRFALYDDNFLFRADAYSKPLLAAIGKLPFEVDFYNPNALNAALIDREVAALLRAAGFREVRIGLETADAGVQKATGGKVSRETFERAVAALREAGFGDDAIKAYVLAGLPQQRWEEARATVDYAAKVGAQVSLAEYTPIPHTPMFEQYAHLARYPIREEPLYQNNALFPFAWEGFTEQDMNRLKAHVREVNERGRVV